MNFRPRRLLAASAASIAAAAAALTLSVSPATAAVSSTQATSENWAGYVAGNANFSAVSGSWVQPTAKCDATTTYSAFWVGLGGASDSSQALEQVGTQADCTARGTTSYYAWYELVPAAPVKLNLAIKPGDHLGAKVRVGGTTVTVSLWNHTTGESVTKTLQTSNIDTSSAEWIAEAPSACDGSGNCQPLTLADFGTVHFTSATATAAGHTGSISDSAWDAQAVNLNGSGTDRHFGPVGAAYEQAAGSSAASAQTSSLTGSGGAFSVAWKQSSTGATGTSGAAGAGTGASYGSGYGYGYGSGSGSGDPYGDGYGYGGSDYSDPGYGSGYGYGGGYGYSAGGYGGTAGGYGDWAGGYGYAAGGVGYSLGL